MAERSDLVGSRFGKLVVEAPGEPSAAGGRRWLCRCDCGAITYKATDTLTNADVSMCKDCAAAYGTSKAREKAGYVGGTQLAKIQEKPIESSNQTGFRGVYRNSRTGRYPVRIRFQKKLYHIGYFDNLDDAIEARRKAEGKFFGSYRELQNP